MKFKFLLKLSIILASLLIIIPLISKINTITEDRIGKTAINPQLIQNVFKNNIQNTDATFGITVWDLNTNQKYFLNENEQFEAASLYKLAVMYTIFYLESKGKLDTDESDIKTNLDAMITVSSNEAGLYLVSNYTSWNEITELITAKGLKQTKLTEFLLLTTPKDIATLLSLINNPNDISPKARGKMMELLRNQTINDRISALLPPEVTIYHKTGDIGDEIHDAGIIQGPNNTNYILVILTKNSAMPEDVKPIMAKVSAEIYNLFKNRSD